MVVSLLGGSARRRDHLESATADEFKVIEHGSSGPTHSPKIATPVPALHTLRRAREGTPKQSEEPLFWLV
jgi:hypothetical protein